MVDDIAPFAAATSRPIGTASESIWRGPLVPVALAATGGILLDRAIEIPLLWTMLAASVALPCCLVSAWRDRPWLTLLLLWTAVACLGMAYHRSQNIFPDDDISNFATLEAQPVLLRGVVYSEPLFIKRGGDDELRSFPSEDGGRFVLRATALRQQVDWQPVTGRVQVYTKKPSGTFHVGDEIEVVGRLQSPSPPSNPGEFDYAGMLRDQRIGAVLLAEDDGDNVRLSKPGSGLSLSRLLAGLRAWGQRTLTDYLPPERQGVAIALLLGDGAPMTQDDWEKYIRTGVIHVLAISGQHLVVLAAFLGLAMRFLRIRLRNAAIITAVFLLGYALLVGGRPPVMRSAVAVCAICGGMLVRRPQVRSNTFALAWLVVICLNPTDVFSMGCQLSFLAVAVLVWGASGWLEPETDPTKQMIEASRPLWLQGLRWLGRHVLLAYAVGLAIWVVVAPLVADRQNVLSLAGLIIGPPTVLLTSIALLSGFVLLLTAPILPPLAFVAAWITDMSLAGCDGLVSWAATWPLSSWYVPRLPLWWLWIYYPTVLGLLMLHTLRRIWIWCVLGLLVLLTVGLLSGAARPRTDELRCTFLAVGHGGCVVLETSGGQTFLYDIGSLRGPELVRRNVAPFLWYRGIRRIDEVFLSHADLDHFNGLTALFDRFSVGQVSCTPSFQDRPTPAVRLTLKELNRRTVPLRVLSSGQHLRAGDVEIDVLHPPTVGPEGNENSRSMVLLIRHEGHAILLTGDLEGTGLNLVTSYPAPIVDVLQAPHHGNLPATRVMVQWAKPLATVSCQAQPRAIAKGMAEDGSEPAFFATWPHGAVTIRSRVGSLTLDTFASKQSWRLK